MTAKHALVAFDFSEPARRALELARTLRAKTHCAVTVVHVFPDPFAELKHPPKESIWASPEQIQAHMRAVRTEVHNVVNDVFGPEAQAVECRVERGTPLDEIRRVAQEEEADLLIVGTTGKGGMERSLLGSVSQSLVRQSPAPLLSVP